MSKIVVAVPDHMKAGLMDTILKRPDVDVEYVSAPDAQQLIKEPPRMLIIFHGIAGEGAAFVNRLVQNFPSLRFPIIMLTKGDLDTNYPEVVKAVFKVDFVLYEFNVGVAGFLGLPIRRSRRFLVHLGATVSVQSQTILATIVKISGSGCLLECNRKLHPGHSFGLEILGMPSFKIPPLTVSIVREEQPPRADCNIRYFSAEFTDIGLPEMESIVERLIG